MRKRLPFFFSSKLKLANQASGCYIVLWSSSKYLVDAFFAHDFINKHMANIVWKDDCGLSTLPFISINVVADKYDACVILSPHQDDLRIKTRFVFYCPEHKNVMLSMIKANKAWNEKVQYAVTGENIEKTRCLENVPEEYKIVNPSYQISPKMNK